MESVASPPPASRARGAAQAGSPPSSVGALGLLSKGELIELHRAGDPDAVEELFGRTRARLERTVRARLGPGLAEHVDPEDVVQDAMADAFAILGQFQARGEQSFDAWLARIAERRLIAAARHGGAQRRERGRELSLERETAFGEMHPEPVDPSPDPIEHASGREIAARVRAAAREQPEDMRLALHLRLFESCSWAEIARLVGRPSAAATRRLTTRALRRLARSLRGLFDGTP